MSTYDDVLKLVDETVRRCGHDPEAAPHAIKVIYLIGQLDFELSNGGVIQWLTNNSGRHARETVDALEEVGAHTCADIVRDMLEVFPSGSPSRDDATRVKQIQELLARVQSTWQVLSERLLEWPDDIDELLREFVKNHTPEFSTKRS